LDEIRAHEGQDFDLRQLQATENSYTFVMIDIEAKLKCEHCRSHAAQSLLVRFQPRAFRLFFRRWPGVRQRVGRGIIDPAVYDYALAKHQASLLRVSPQHLNENVLVGLDFCISAIIASPIEKLGQAAPAPRTQLLAVV
jgi:hypothetical protein